MMKKTIVTYNQYDIVTVPFPFVDSYNAKQRPAIILSSTSFNNHAHHSIMAMITSARNKPWPCDVDISNLTESGLPKPSIIRMKFFTIDHRLIIKTIGILSTKDKNTFRKTIKS